MRSITFTPIVVVDYDADGHIVCVEIDWFDSVNFGDDAVNQAERDGVLDDLTDEFDKFISSKEWKWQA